MLEALRAKPYTLRTLKGVATDSGIDVSEALALLGKLESLGLARSVTSRKTKNPLYQLTGQGVFALSIRDGVA